MFSWKLLLMTNVQHTFLSEVLEGSLIECFCHFCNLADSAKSEFCLIHRYLQEQNGNRE